MSNPATPIDSAKLEELEELFGDLAEVSSLFRDFFAELPTHLQSLHTALESSGAADHESVDQVHRTAHTLKGSSGGLGATGIQEAAMQLEESARKDELAEAPEQLVHLEHEIERLRGWLSENDLL